MPPDQHDYPIVPHMDTGDPDCCGCLVVNVRGDEADLVCNECGALVRTVPAAQAGSTLMAMVSDAVCSARCPHCTALNTFPGFSEISAFVCQECGEGVTIDETVQ